MQKAEQLQSNESNTLKAKCNEYDTLKENLHTIKVNELNDYKKKSDYSDYLKRNELKVKSDESNDYKKKSEEMEAIKKNPSPTRNKFNLDGIEFGLNWFELSYSDNSKNYIKHSTKENLIDYFNRLQMNNSSINKPIRIKPIAIDGIRIVYLN